MEVDEFMIGKDGIIKKIFFDGRISYVTSKTMDRQVGEGHFVISRDH